jgi:hypothetical protein
VCLSAADDTHLQSAGRGAARTNHPELRYLESKFAGLVSYGLSARWLAETLPIGRPLYASAVRLHAQATGERLESELGPEHSMFADGCQLDWDELPAARSAADGWPGWRLRAFEPATLTARRLVRSDCWQEHADRRLSEVLRLRRRTTPSPSDACSRC